MREGLLGFLGLCVLGASPLFAQTNAGNETVPEIVPVAASDVVEPPVFGMDIVPIAPPACCGPRVWGGAEYLAGSTSALLPGNKTPSQASIRFIISAGGWSSGMRTGMAPAISRARSYCGRERCT